MKIKVPTVLEQLLHLSKGPIWDGNLISKSSRDKLVDEELVVRTRHGFQTITPKGVELLSVLELLTPDKNYEKLVEVSPLGPAEVELSIPTPSFWDSVTCKDLALMLKICLEKYGEDAIEEACDPIVDEWQSKQSKEEDEVELVEVSSEEALPVSACAKDGCISMTEPGFNWCEDHKYKA